MINWFLYYWEIFKVWWHKNLILIPREDYKPLLDISGFLGILAFSVAVFTLTSPRFQIRQATAIISFRPLFFGTLFISAVITFTIEGCILYGVPFPRFFNPNTVNYLLTAIISALIFYWMKISFVRPSRFSRFTAKHFVQQAYICITNGSKEEMLALAQEIMREAPRLIRHAPRTKSRHFKADNLDKLSTLQTDAYYLISLLSDTRFCDVVAKEIPSFPAHMVEVSIQLERYDAPIHLMVKRTVLAMLNNPRSALFVENEWLGQGFIGNAKPITRSIFGYWYLFEPYQSELEAPLYLHYPYARNWDTDTWRVYFGMAREYIHGLTSVNRTNWSAEGIRHILETTEQAYSQLSDLDRYEDAFGPYNPISHAREANEFLRDLVKSFDTDQGWVSFDRKDHLRFGHDLSSELAELHFEMIFTASQVNTKEFRMWQVQHNTVWAPIEKLEIRDTHIMKMVRRKVRRMIWDEVVRMDDFPNYKGAAYVRFCLNVLGFYEESTHRRNNSEKDSWPLAKVIGRWVKKNYQTIAISHPPVAKAMLPANIEYNRNTQTLLRSDDNTLTGVPRQTTLALNAPRNVKSG
jgi:hypothetical protein